MTALAPIALATEGVAAGAQALGSINQGNAMASADRWNAQESAYAGKVDAAQSIAQSQDIAQQNERRQGAVRAAYGASGVDPNAGTALKVMADQAAQGERAKLYALYQGRTKQHAADVQGNVDLYDAKTAQQASYMQAGTTLLSNLVKMGSQAYGMAGGGGGGNIPASGG